MQIFRSVVEKTMTNHEQENAFADDLEKLINRYLMEFDMSVSAIIGALEVAKLDVWDESRGSDYIIELE